MEIIDDLFNKTIELRNMRSSVLEQLKLNRLVYGELEVLYLLNKNQALNPSKISNLLNRNPATVSRTIKTLEELGLITYENDKDNRRRIFVGLSKDGREMITSIINTVG